MPGSRSPGYASGSRGGGDLLAWGQQKAFDEEHNSRPPRSWWAFYDTGRWHIGRLHRELEWNRPQRFLTLRPPLHPQATQLTVILTGGECRAQVALPLNWQPPTNATMCTWNDRY